MVIQPGFATDQGAREDQQDSFSLSRFDDKRFVADFGVMAVVTDGMGGYAGGQQASYHAAQTMREAYENKAVQEPIPEALLRALGQANKRVREEGTRMDTKEIGTTLVSAVIHRQDLYWIAAGDSRAYLCRKGELTPLTYDHNRAMELLDEVATGTINLQDARSDPEREGLISFLGQSRISHIDRNIRPLKLQEEDRVLLCTDGLYRSLAEHDILRLLEDPDPQSAAEQLVQAALREQLPHQDNVTVAILAAVPSAPEIARKFMRRLDRRSTILIGSAALTVLVAAALVQLFPRNKTLPDHFDAPSDAMVDSSHAVAPGTTAAVQNSSSATPSGAAVGSQSRVRRSKNAWDDHASLSGVPYSLDTVPFNDATIFPLTNHCGVDRPQRPPNLSTDKTESLKDSAKVFLHKYFEALGAQNVVFVRDAWIWFKPDLEDKIRNYEYARLDAIIAGPDLSHGETNAICARLLVKTTLKEAGAAPSTSEVKYYLQRFGGDWVIAESKW